MVKYWKAMPNPKANRKSRTQTANILSVKIDPDPNQTAIDGKITASHTATMSPRVQPAPRCVVPFPTATAPARRPQEKQSREYEAIAASPGQIHLSPIARAVTPLQISIMTCPYDSSANSAVPPTTLPSNTGTMKPLNIVHTPNCPFATSMNASMLPAIICMNPPAAIR